MLRLLYGDALQERYAVVQRLLDEAREGAGDWSLLDVCAGDGDIAKRLAPPKPRYIAVDGNASFVSALAGQGIEAHLKDVRTDPLPEADIVLMMGSLCHFFPDHRRIVDKLKRSARKRVIVVEPHVNWSARGGPLGWLSQRMSDPGIEGAHLGRLSAADLDVLAAQTLASDVIRLEREHVLVWDLTRAHGSRDA